MNWIIKVIKDRREALKREAKTSQQDNNNVQEEKCDAPSNFLKKSNRKIQMNSFDYKFYFRRKISLFGFTHQGVRNECGFQRRRHPWRSWHRHVRGNSNFSQVLISLSCLFFKIVFSWLAVQGHDTTASAMTWFLYCIAKHPEHQVLLQ